MKTNLFNMWVFFCLLYTSLTGQYLLIPMNTQQTNHLKAYGIVYTAIQKGAKGEWLLNYEGGAFLLPYTNSMEELCVLRGVKVRQLSGAAVNDIYALIESSNMERVILEKAPEIAVYVPPYFQPWDDAVMMALEYAEIPYQRIYDEDVLRNRLSEFDWLHLHHEDFTGQLGKFYGNYRHAAWYIKQKQFLDNLARKLGFPHIPALKKAVAVKIDEYVREGGLLFAMCSATDALDIALASVGVDIVDTPFDGSPPEPAYQSKLDYKVTMAFTNFKLYTNPNIYEYSDIDYPPGFQPVVRDAVSDYFSLFNFSAKYDPVATMLVQDHVSEVKGFMGQTTMFVRDKIKPGVTILGEMPGTNYVKYIHGIHGKGSFTFLAGHDPEDYTHAVGDPKTDLSLHPNSPGYRLILNNILFPAAKKKKLKT